MQAILRDNDMIVATEALDGIEEMTKLLNHQRKIKLLVIVSKEMIEIF